MKHQDIISQMTLEEKCYLLSGKDFWQTRSVERLGLNGSVPATCYPTVATLTAELIQRHNDV